MPLNFTSPVVSAMPRPGFTPANREKAGQLPHAVEAKAASMIGLPWKWQGKYQSSGSHHIRADEALIELTAGFGNLS